MAVKEKKEENKVFISEADQYLFAQGTHYDIYKKLGAHPSVENGKEGMFFGVWAPNAASVHVIVSFNGWGQNSQSCAIIFVDICTCAIMDKWCIIRHTGRRTAN